MSDIIATEKGIYDLHTVDGCYRYLGESGLGSRELAALERIYKSALTTPATVPSEPVPEDLMQYLLDVKVFLSFLARDFKSDRIYKLMDPPVSVYVQLEKMLEQYVYKTDWYNDKVFGPAKEPV